MNDTGMETLIIPRASDIGGFRVQRALPSARRRMVGPFVFFDQMGPEILAPGRGLDVAPHPHIGLATVTYLFEGEILHRDSLGSVQRISPGDVNWMTAGSGIVHSERTPPDLRASGGPIFGVQTWVALPERFEETAPDFNHHAGNELPVIEDGNIRMRLIVGELHGKRSPVATFSETLYADIELPANSRLALEPSHEERAVYLATGSVRIDGEVIEPGNVAVLKAGMQVIAETSDSPARLLYFGGEPMDSYRFIWWNFVSSSRDRIEQAREDWKNNRMGIVPEESERIPLPEGKPKPVKYP